MTCEIDILDVDLKEHILFILQEAGMDTLGDLVLQMRIDPDRILGLNGIGPKTFAEIQELTDGLRVIPEEPQPEPEAITEAPIEEEAVVEADVVEEAPVLAEPEVEEEPVVAETPEVVEPVKPVVPEKPEPVEEEEEEDDFDKLFSYDASKYGYYEPEKVTFDEEEQKDVKPTKKKKRKKPRPPVDEPDHWDEW